MRLARLGIGLATLLVSGQLLSAQQPAPKSPGARGPGGMVGMMEMQQRMDSLDARLDSLLSRMNRASGNQKVTAMAAVINELVVQRKGMREHMRLMMESHGEMRRGERTPAGAPPPARRKSTPPDSGEHSEHHPPESP